MSAWLIPVTVTFCAYCAGYWTANYYIMNFRLHALKSFMLRRLIRAMERILEKRGEK